MTALDALFSPCQDAALRRSVDAIVPTHTILVTGASGFVATEVIAQLLAKGYQVRGTVRSTKDQDKVAHLKALGEVRAQLLLWFAPHFTQAYLSVTQAICSVFMQHCKLQTQDMPVKFCTTLCECIF